MVEWAGRPSASLRPRRSTSRSEPLAPAGRPLDMRPENVGHDGRKHLRGCAFGGPEPKSGGHDPRNTSVAALWGCWAPIRRPRRTNHPDGCTFGGSGPKSGGHHALKHLRGCALGALGRDPAATTDEKTRRLHFWGPWGPKTTATEHEPPLVAATLGSVGRGARSGHRRPGRGRLPYRTRGAGITPASSWNCPKTESWNWVAPGRWPTNDCRSMALPSRPTSNPLTDAVSVSPTLRLT